MRIFCFLLYILSLFSFGGQVAYAQSGEVIYLTPELVSGDRQMRLHNGWRYHPGDSLAWADPGMADDHWELIESTALPPGELPKSGWSGRGWFRLHVDVDSTLWGKPLGIAMIRAKTPDLYLDGRLLYSDLNRHPQVIIFPPGTRHLLAVRFINEQLEAFHQGGADAGFVLVIGDRHRMQAQRESTLRMESGVQMFFAAFFMAIGILHLVLFFFMPGGKANLYYAIFLFCAAAATFFDYQVVLADAITEQILNLRLQRGVSVLVWLFGMRFIYELFYPRLPGRFFFFCAAGVVMASLAVYDPSRFSIYLWYLLVIVMLEMTRSIIVAVSKRVDGAWIIAIGCLSMYCFISYDLLLDLGIMEPFRDIGNAYMLGISALIISSSVYLARDISRKNEKLIVRERQVKEQEIQRRLLEADNARKTRELEDARNLQLSMLPQALPVVSNLELAAEMRTANEVGGDYYDFLHADGYLTLAIGDATGHGARAGTMVMCIKTLFNTSLHRTTIVDFFHECTRTIKSMNLGNLYMAMTVARIKDHTMELSAAGMPPALIYREKDKSVEEVVLKGMPLGAHPGFPYQTKSVMLYPGDVVLFITDGFEELLNDSGETLEFKRVKEAFRKAARSSPAHIVDALFAKASTWRKSRPQNDDITLLVLKMIS